MERRFTYRTPQEAFDAITKALPVRRLGSESIEVGNAYGRILAQEFVAPVNLPPHDMSHFDGYAVRAEDTTGASVQNPRYFTIIGELYPGQPPDYKVQGGEAVYVATGSFLPKGANTVVAVEATKRVKSTQIEVRSTVDPHEHVIDCGSDIQRGVTLFRDGHKLRAQDLSILATLGIERLPVVKQPMVAIICVGDELTDAVQTREPGKVVNSLRYTVSAMIRETGGRPVYLGITPDNVAQLRTKIIEGIAIADLVLIIGGSSMGEKDITAASINSLGNPGIIVHGLKRKPGRVSGFAIVQDKPIVILPGLCHSTVVGFYTLALPVLLVMSGCAAPNARLVVNAKLMQPISFTSFLPFEQVTFVHLKRTAEGYLADPHVAASSSYHALARSNAFVITPPGTAIVSSREAVEAHLLPSFFTLNTIFARSN